MANEKRLIDAYALAAEFMELADTGIEFDGEGVANAIANAPTIEAEPVRHGWWERYANDKFIGYDATGKLKYRKVYTYECSECGLSTAVRMNYCPNCGAKMDGEGRDTEWWSEYIPATIAAKS